MLANPNKFQAIVLGCKNSDIKFNIGGIEIVPEKQVGMLGLYIDDRLSFDYHVEHIIGKAARQLNVLKRFSHILDLPSKMSIMKAFITSNFDYCCILWHFCNGRMSKRVEQVQTRALHFVYLDFENDYNSLLERAKIDSLYINRKGSFL